MLKTETLTTNGSDKTFTLLQKFKAGTTLIRYNGRIFYEFFEVSGSGNEAKITLDFAPLSTDKVVVQFYPINEPSTLNASRYISPRQVKAMSRSADLIALSDDAIEKFIREVERYIDAIVGGWGRYYESADSLDTQLRTFPRVQDDRLENEYPGIPEAVTMAALYGVENVFSLGAPSAINPADSSYESETLGDYSYKKTTKSSANNSSDYIEQYLGTRSISMLNHLIKNHGRLTVSNEWDNYGLLNSRQKFIHDN